MHKFTAALTAVVATAGVATLTTTPAEAGNNNASVTTSKHGVLLTTLPDCAEGVRPCLRETGEFAGFWLGQFSDRAHFVWTINPVAGNRPERHWPGEYGQEFIDAIAASHNGNRNWDHCWFDLEPRQVSYLHCPDGTESRM